LAACTNGTCTRCPTTLEDVASLYCPLRPVVAGEAGPAGGATVSWALRWTVPCDGLLGVVTGNGADCQNVYLFDPASHALVAAGDYSPDCPIACGSTDGHLAFPKDCFTSDTLESLPKVGPVPLCPQPDGGDGEGGSDAGEGG
jgi:hypothetical protein